MQDFVGVASSVSRKMRKKMRLLVDPKQSASKHFVVILATRADTFLGDQVRDVALPSQLKGSADVSRLDRRRILRQLC